MLERIFIARNKPCRAARTLMFEHRTYILIELEDILIYSYALSVGRIADNQTCRLTLRQLLQTNLFEFNIALQSRTFNILFCHTNRIERGV